MATLASQAGQANSACILCYELLGTDLQSILSCSCKLCRSCYNELLLQQHQPDGSLKYDQTLLCQCLNPTPVVLIPVDTTAVVGDNRVNTNPIDPSKRHRLSLIRAKEIANSIAKLTKQIRGTISNINDRQRHALDRTMAQLSHFNYLIPLQLKRQRAEQLVAKLMAINTAVIKNLNSQLVDLNHLKSVYDNILDGYVVLFTGSVRSVDPAKDPTAWFQKSFLDFTESTLKRARSVRQANRYHNEIFIYLELFPVALDQIGVIGPVYAPGATQGYQQDTTRNRVQLNWLDHTQTRAETEWVDFHQAEFKTGRHQSWYFESNNPLAESKFFIDSYYRKPARPGLPPNIFIVQLVHDRLIYTDVRYDLDSEGNKVADPKAANRRFTVIYTYPELQYVSIETPQFD